MGPSGLTGVGGQAGERQRGGYSEAARDLLSAARSCTAAGRHGGRDRPLRASAISICLPFFVPHTCPVVPYPLPCPLEVGDAGPRPPLPGAPIPTLCLCPVRLQAPLARPPPSLLLPCQAPAPFPLPSAFSATLLSFLSLTCLPGMSQPGSGSSYLPRPHCFSWCPLPSDSGRNPTR